MWNVWDKIHGGSLFIGHLKRKLVKHLDDLKWESFSENLDYIAYSMNEDLNFSNCREQCLKMNASLLTIPKNAKSLFYFLKAVDRLGRTSTNSIAFFLQFEKQDMPNIVHEVFKILYITYRIYLIFKLYQSLWGT